MSRAFLICPEPLRAVTAGVGTRFLTLARILAEAGHGVTLAVPNDATEAPEIDGVVYLNDGITDSMRPGEIREVLITEAHEYDLVGEVRR